MDALKLLGDLWPVAACAIGLIIWSVRLESRVANSHSRIDSIGERAGVLDQDLRSLTIKHEAMDSRTVEQLAQVRESLARIEGALGVNPQN